MSAPIVHSPSSGSRSGNLGRSRQSSTTSSSIDEARAALSSRLRARLPEIEAAVAARVYAIAPPRETADPAYLEGLRSSLTISLDYALVALERGEERAPMVPPALLAQARMAARNGVRLDIVLRRYFAGYSLLSEFAIAEAEQGDLSTDSVLQRVFRGQAAIFDRLVAAVTEEHRREESGRPSSTEQRRAQRVERLLAGEAIDASALDYDLDALHIGAVASGPVASEGLRDLAAALEARLLLVRREDDTSWAWLGSHRRFDPEALKRHFSAAWPAQARLALGEPSQGLAGWRLTHRQAAAALPVALRGSRNPVRYAEVALLASMLKDDLLLVSLPELYLKPLQPERNGGRVLLETLRAYFATGRNVSSAAASLGVSRRTVTSRVRTIEERLGRPLNSTSAELEAALRVSELDGDWAVPRTR